MGGSGKGGDQFIYNSTTDTGKGRKQRDTILDFKGTQGDRIHFKRWMPIPINQATNPCALLMMHLSAKSLANYALHQQAEDQYR